MSMMTSAVAAQSSAIGCGSAASKLVVADVAMTDCAPGAGNCSRIEASGVPLCTAKARRWILQISVFGQMLGVTLRARLAARDGRHDHLCLICEQRHLRCAAAIV